MQECDPLLTRSAEDKLASPSKRDREGGEGGEVGGVAAGSKKPKKKADTTLAPSTTGDGIFPAAMFGSKFGMGRDRWENI